MIEQLSETQQALLNLMRDLEYARQRYDEAAEQEKLARSNETAAQNHLNAAQKKFDEFVAKLKRESPINSDWRREERNASSVGVKQ